MPSRHARQRYPLCRGRRLRLHGQSVPAMHWQSASARAPACTPWPRPRVGRASSSAEGRWARPRPPRTSPRPPPGPPPLIIIIRLGVCGAPLAIQPDSVLVAEVMLCACGGERLPLRVGSLHHSPRLSRLGAVVPRQPRAMGGGGGEWQVAAVAFDSPELAGVIAGAQC